MLPLTEYLKLVFQGEAGRDGLSLPGPAGPPGPPGPIINLQDVSSALLSPAILYRTVEV